MKAIKKPVKLSARDANVVSVIAQQVALPRAYLLKLAQSAGVSKEAYLIIESVTEPRARVGTTRKKPLLSTKKSAKKSVGKKVAKKASKKKNPALHLSARSATAGYQAWVGSLKG